MNKKIEKIKPQRIGILGGMGPLAGVQLQELIIKTTPATCDQEHLEVISFTAPKIPDRTDSLEKDDGAAYTRALTQAAQTLVDAGATLLAIPCNTAHARLTDIQKKIEIPIIDMIGLVTEHLRQKIGSSASIALLATNGTLSEKIYEKRAAKEARWILPDTYDQKVISQIIYGIKAGERPTRYQEDIAKITAYLKQQGAEAVILGCTELSLFYEYLTRLEHAVIDPLRILAQHIVELSLPAKETVKKIELYSAVR